MNRSKLLAPLILCVMAVGCATQSAPTTASDAAADRAAPAPAASDVPVTGAPLRVGLTPNAPPFVYAGEDGITGLEPEFAKLLGAALGRPVVTADLAWEQLIPALLNNEIDIIMSGMAATDARKTQVQFCKPYLRVGQMALVRADDAPSYRTSGDVRFTRARVGTLEDSVADAYVAKEFRFAEQYHVDTAEIGLEALVRHDIDLLLASAPTIWWLADSHPSSNVVALPHTFSSEYLAWAVRPEDHAFRQQVNEAMQRLGMSGQLDATLDAWLPDRR